MLLSCTWIADYEQIMSRSLENLTNVRCHSQNTYKEFSGKKIVIFDSLTSVSNHLYVMKAEFITMLIIRS